MRILPLLLPLFLTLASGALPLRAETADDPKAQVIEAVNAAETKEELEAGLKKAKQLGATNQQILEGKLLWSVIRAQNIEYFDTLAGEIDAILPKWNRSEGAILKKPSQIEAMKHYIAALKASAAGSADLAQKEILQAVWLDPSRPLYVKEISHLRPSDEKIPMDITIRTAEGEKTTLAECVKGKKAIYIDIWATWCGPCIRSFPVLSARAKSLPPQGVAVVALNSDLGREGVTGGDPVAAKEMKVEKHMQLPWLVEPKDAPYTELLGVDSVPRALLVDPQGNVLFNDHPMEQSLVVALKKLSVDLDLHAGAVAGAE